MAPPQAPGTLTCAGLTRWLLVSYFYAQIGHCLPATPTDILDGRGSVFFDCPRGLSNTGESGDNLPASHDFICNQPTVRHVPDAIATSVPCNFRSNYPRLVLDTSTSRVIRLIGAPSCPSRPVGSAPPAPWTMTERGSKLAGCGATGNTGKRNATCIAASAQLVSD